MSDITRLPWPFKPYESDFRYAVNVEHAKIPVTTPVGEWGSRIFDIDGTYLDKIDRRRRILAGDPQRLTVLPHMEPACWDYLLFAMRELAVTYPDTMHLAEDGDDLHWRNDLLGIDDEFRFGDAASLGGRHPLAYIGCQVPSDILLVTERDDGHLYFDAGLVTFPGAWSVTFDVGMSMHEIHGPVPEFTGRGVTDRLEQFMKSLTPDLIYRRINWTFSDSGSQRLDTSLETSPDWGWDLAQMIHDKDWGRLRLRLELEHFIRLPLTDAIVFDIRTYMAPLTEIAAVPEWRDQLVQIVTSVPENIARYKGFAAYREEAMAWLAAQ